MATRVVEWKKPYTWGKAIEIDENKVISLRLRDENNLIIYDEGDDEIYVDLQLKDWIRPTDAFPVWITTGRVLVADDWDITGTLICAKTTSWDNIKLLYGDDGTLWIDNWTWTFKQIYFKSDVDQLLQELRTYVNQQLALKQDKLIAGDNISIDPTTNTISADVPPLSRFLSLWDCATWLPLSFPASVPFDYVTWDHYLVETVWTTNYRPSGSQYTGVASTTVETDPDIAIWDSYIYDGTVWLLQKNSWGGGWGTVVSFSNIVWNPTDNTALANALNAKANATDVNTKTFYLSWTSGATALAEAQEAYDWYLAGENPIIIYNNMAFSLYSNTTLAIQFVSNYDYTLVNNSYTKIYKKSLTFAHDSWSSTITNIYYDNQNVDAVPFLSPWNDYSTPYTPTYNWSPTTKKYVDDRDTYIGSSEPTSNKVEWRLWYDTTNDQLKVYDWTNWNITGAESNTKTFTITWTTGTANISAMQEAIDWLNAGKYPIIYYNTPGYENYWFYTAQYKSSSTVKFQRNRWLQDASAVQLAPLNRAVLSVYLTNGSVTSMSYASKIQSVLTTDNTTSYTPSWDYNPATKKYVDNSIQQKRQFHVFDYDNITSSDVEAILGILADNEKWIAFVTESIGALVSSVPTMIYITSWNYSGTELYLYWFSFDNWDSPEVTTYSFIIDSTDYSITYDESLAYSLVWRTADSWKVLTGTWSGFGWEEPTFKVYNVDDVHNPSVSAGTLSNIVNKLKTDGKTAILYDAPNEYMYYPTELSISTLSWDIYWTSIHDSSVTIIHRPVSRASATSNRTLWTVTESDKYLSPNPIQVVSALPATPNADTIYIVK